MKFYCPPSLYYVPLSFSRCLLKTPAIAARASVIAKKRRNKDIDQVHEDLKARTRFAFNFSHHMFGQTSYPEHDKRKCRSFENMTRYFSMNSCENVRGLGPWLFILSDC